MANSSDAVICFGNGLSPVIFFIDMNDVPDLLKAKNCKGVKIERINCLMYA